MLDNDDVDQTPWVLGFRVDRFVERLKVGGGHTVTANGTLTSCQAASFHPILAGQQLGGCRCSRDRYFQIADMVDPCQCKNISFFSFFLMSSDFTRKTPFWAVFDRFGT